MRTICVAEDDGMTRLALSTNLQKWGYRVVAVDNGARAFELLTRRDPPRLAILDWMMPGMEGIEICRRLSERAGSPLIYTILLTVKSGKKDIVSALDGGAHDFLSKPVHTGELRSRIAVGLRLVETEDMMSEYTRKIESKNRQLERALSEIKTLRGILPICAQCKKVRDDAGYWNQIEVYISEHSHADFSHSLCPGCVAVLYPDIKFEET